MQFEVSRRGVDVLVNGMLVDFQTLLQVEFTNVILTNLGNKKSYSYRLAALKLPCVSQKTNGASWHVPGSLTAHGQHHSVVQLAVRSQ